MRYLTRKEELLLLAVLKLDREASLLNIRAFLDRNTEKKWTIGNVYVALDRLTKTGMLTCRAGEVSPRRGGKAVQHYHLTAEGRAAMTALKKIQDLLWRDAAGLLSKE